MRARSSLVEKKGKREKRKTAFVVERLDRWVKHIRAVAALLIYTFIEEEWYSMLYFENLTGGNSLTTTTKTRLRYIDGQENEVSRFN